MNTAMITCPNCGTEIALSEALQEQFRHENEARLAALAGQAQAEGARGFRLRKAAPRSTARRGAPQARGRAAGRARAAQGKGRARGSRARARSRSGAPGRQREAAPGGALRRRFAEQQDLKLKEKDKLIDDLRHSLDEAKRKSEQGSQQRQGEVLETRRRGRARAPLPA